VESQPVRIISSLSTDGLKETLRRGVSSHDKGDVAKASQNLGSGI
jgi:hypothetical protein